MTRPSCATFSRRLLGGAAAALAFVGCISSQANAAEEEVSVTDAVVVDHHYQLGINASVRSMQGSFDAYGNYTAFPDGSISDSLVWNMNASYRVTQLLELGMSLPLRYSFMDFPTGISSSIGINSPGLDARFHLGGWPHLVVHVGGTGPWKYSSSVIQGNPQASMPNDMGDGFVPGASLRTGVGGSHSFGRWRFALDISETHPFASTSSPTDGSAPMTTQMGDQISLSQGVSFLVSPRWSINGGFRQYWSGPSSANGIQDETSLTRSYSTSIGGSYIPEGHWRFNAAYETQFPFYAYAVGIPYSPAVTFGASFVGM